MQKSLCCIKRRIWAKGWAGPEPVLPVTIRDRGGVCIVNSVAYSDSKHLTRHPSQNDAGQGTRLLSGGSEHNPLCLVRNIQTAADKLDSRRNSPLYSFSNQPILVVCHTVRHGIKEPFGFILKLIISVLGSCVVISLDTTKWGHEPITKQIGSTVLLSFWGKTTSSLF